MNTVLHVLLLLIGFVLLIKGADFFVEGSSSIAKLLKIPSIIIGLTVVSLGTSAPELAVSISAAIKGSNEIAISNVIGSNIFNLLVVLGVCALIKPMHVRESVRKVDYPFSILAAIALLILMADKFMPWSNFQASTQTPDKLSGIITRFDAVILILLLIVYMWITISGSLRDRKNAASNTEEKKENKISPLLSGIFVIGGVAAIIFGGNMVVDNATAIAKSIGMSDTLVGLTIVAIGTSLPELVTSVVASRKGENDIAIGNVVGSNILNIFCILGVSSLIHPISIGLTSVIDLTLFAIASILTYFFINSRKKITRTEGFIMVLLYIIYSAYIIIR